MSGSPLDDWVAVRPNTSEPKALTMAAEEHNPFLAVRSVIETPVLDERKWAKIPQIPTDGVLCDMEDAVPRTRKLEGRDAVIRAIGNQGQFDGRMVWARCNDLTTEWGHDDVVALGKAGVENMMIPKVSSAADVDEYRRILNDHGADPDLIACIETPAAVAHVEEIVAHEKVKAIAFGEGDLTALLGIQIYEPDGSLNPVLAPARSRVYLAAAAHNVARFESAFVPDVKNLDDFRVRAETFARTAATGMVAIYPPHVQIVNEVFTPTAEQVEYSRKVVKAFDDAIAAGAPAVQLDNGKVLLIHDYSKAKQVLARVPEDEEPVPAGG